MASRSKIDTWSTTPTQRNVNRSVYQPTQIKTEAKARVDTWLPTTYQTRQRSVEVRHYFTSHYSNQSSLCCSTRFCINHYMSLVDLELTLGSKLPNPLRRYQQW